MLTEIEDNEDQSTDGENSIEENIEEIIDENNSDDEDGEAEEFVSTEENEDETVMSLSNII